MRWKIFVATAILASLAFQVLPGEAEQGPAMAVPFASQFDGSSFAASDCGPASVAMAIDYATGEHLTPLQARQAIIHLPGGGYAANPGSGTAIQDLARVARLHDVDTFMGDGAASTGWASARIRSHIAQGHPVIVLTRLAYLPGYSPTSQVDHYIIVTGATPAGYTYNDPALANGRNRTISEKQLQLAQRMSSVPGQGAAFGGPAAAPEAPSTPMRKITVVAGDTLSQLAEKYAVDLQQIVELNRHTVTNINHIEVGQVLNVPDVTPTASTKSTASTDSPATTTSTASTASAASIASSAPSESSRRNHES